VLEVLRFYFLNKSIMSLLASEDEPVTLDVCFYAKHVYRFLCN
jgi:hypothetical protein